MRVRILGTAAGGGLPQWNCGCAVCVQARTTGHHRLQDGLAVTGDGSSWYLVNASPDIRHQLLAHADLRPPPTTRASPVRGVLLTSAELDHTVGLLSLREATEMAVWCTPTVRTVLPFGGALEAYITVHWHDVTPHQPVELDGGLLVTAFAPGAKRPRYAAGADGLNWTVAYRITDIGTGGVLVYAPGLASWTGAFAAGIVGADVVLLDGTFATRHESPVTGHMSIEDSLPRLLGQPGPRYLYTHLNNTNPFAGAVEVLPGRTDIRVAADGELLVL